MVEFSFRALPLAPNPYFQSKTDAEAYAQQLLELNPYRIASADVQLEPDEGWVIVLVPALCDLSDLHGVAEVVSPGRKKVINRLRRYNLKPKAQSNKSHSNKSSTPRGGVSKRVWELAVELGGDRGKVIEAAVAEGINRGTAATQFSKWRKEHGK